jgi:hypothetical protein
VTDPVVDAVRRQIAACKAAAEAWDEYKALRRVSWSEWLRVDRLRKAARQATADADAAQDAAWGRLRGEPAEPEPTLF